MGGHSKIVPFLAPARSAAAARPAPEAFETFFRHERPALLKFLRQHVRSDQDAEEAAQDSFVRLLRYRDSKPMEAWRFLLYRIAANIATDRSRRAHSRRATDHVDWNVLDLPSEDATQEQVVAQRQELALLQAAILSLPPKCRQVFLLNRIHGMSYAQIAQHCHISLKMVEKHINKAIKLCAVKVERGRV